MLEIQNVYESYMFCMLVSILIYRKESHKAEAAGSQLTQHSLLTTSCLIIR